jgi:hypothetical protein
MRRCIFAATLFWLAGLLHGNTWAAFPTTVNYQGELRENGVPREGTVDLFFAVLDESGFTSQIILVDNVPVVRGLFTAPLQLNSTVTENAQNYTLLIGIRDGALDTGGLDSYQFLQPQQSIASVPFAENAHLIDGLHPADLVRAWRSTFDSVDIPDTGPQNRVELTSISTTAPADGTLIARGRGYCYVGANSGAPEVIVFAVGQTSDSAFENGQYANWGKISPSLNAGQTTAMFNSERTFPVTRGANVPLRLYASRFEGSSSAQCWGSMTIEFLPSSP